MPRKFVVLAVLPLFLLSLMLASCDKEKIVENTEYVHDIEYIQLPPDTVYRHDTVRVNDSVTVHDVDTVIQVSYVHDTVTVTNTVTVHDTVYTVQHHYDTITVIDTVVSQQFTPNQNLAYSALEYYCDDLVIDFINQNFGYNDGWVFYLSVHQSAVVKQSSTTYDIGGYIDYWTPDWSGYYALEFNWRMTYNNGDPASPMSWTITEPPTGSPSQPAPGIRLVPNHTETQSSFR